MQILGQLTPVSSSPLPNIWNLSETQNLISWHGNRKAKFANKFSKIISSEAKIGVGGGGGAGEAEMFIALASTQMAFLVDIALVLSLPWQLKISNDLKWEKWKICLYCYLTADILTSVLQECSLSSPLPNIWNLSKTLNLIGWHGNRKAKCANKFSKIISTEATMGVKLKLCRNVYNISFYKKTFLVDVALVLSLLWQLKVSSDLKWEKWKSAFIAIALQIFWQELYRKVPWVILWQTYYLCQNPWKWLVAMQQKG